MLFHRKKGTVRKSRGQSARRRPRWSSQGGGIKAKIIYEKQSIVNEHMDFERFNEIKTKVRLDILQLINKSGS